MEFVIVIILHIVLVGRRFDDNDFLNKPALNEGKIIKNKVINSTLISPVSLS